jgi:transcriptional/translational regulatory protein YebC/TACO1
MSKAKSKAKIKTRYFVEFWYEVGGRIEVEAKSLQSAKKIIRTRLDAYGLEDLGEYEPLHRDWDITGGESITQAEEELNTIINNAQTCELCGQHISMCKC